MSLQHRAVTERESSVYGIFDDHEDMCQEPHPCSGGGNDASAVVVTVSSPSRDDEEHHVTVPQTVDLA